MYLPGLFPQRSARNDSYFPSHLGDCRTHIHASCSHWHTRVLFLHPKIYYTGLLRCIMILRTLHGRIFPKLLLCIPSTHMITLRQELRHLFLPPDRCNKVGSGPMVTCTWSSSGYRMYQDREVGPGLQRLWGHSISLGCKEGGKTHCRQ